ncbi:MAG TPA: shikimate dehydrogenase [Patescibacteria group bacterium]
MKITSKTKICVVIGDPVEHSLSPQIHNAGYVAKNIDDQFVYVASRIQSKNLESFIKTIKIMNIRGVSVTNPHKIKIMSYLDQIDATAQKIGAVNTLVNDHGILKGYNTDWLGVTTPLERITNLKNKQVAVLGAGGAARAAVFGLLQKNCQVVIFNRTLATAQKLAQEFNCQFASLTDITKIRNMDIIFNTIPESLTAEYLTDKQIIFDAIYSPYETALLKTAKTKNATIIYGTEMLLYQAVAQFKLFTGIDAPVEQMRKTLLTNINL